MRRNEPIRGVAATVMLVMALAAGPLSAQETEIVFPVIINAVPVGESNVLIVSDDFYLPVATLERGRVAGVSWERVLTVARLRNAERLVGGEPAVSLRSLAPWTTFQFDEAELRLSLTVDPNLLGASSMTVHDARPSDIRYSEDNSTFLNYAVSSSGFSGVTAFAEIGSSIGGNLLYTSLSSVPG
ncbi:MAG TPA: hypothetical protein VM779_05935, partial [Thermoanaerobaculia bacterium]|nr:hypothetical protein [Thermoanaerobaculia bacterium]